MQRRRQPGSRIGQQVVDLFDLVVMAVKLAALALRLQRLTDQMLVVNTLHRSNLHSPANESITVSQRSTGALDSLLAVIAWCCCIADIVAGRQQRNLSRPQSGNTYIHNTVCHFYPRFS